MFILHSVSYKSRSLTRLLLCTCALFSFIFLGVNQTASKYVSGMGQHIVGGSLITPAFPTPNSETLEKERNQTAGVGGNLSPLKILRPHALCIDLFWMGGMAGVQIGSVLVTRQTYSQRISQRMVNSPIIPSNGTDKCDGT